MKKKLLIGFGALIGISLIIVIVAVVTTPGEQPRQVEPAPAAPAPEKTGLTSSEQSYAVTVTQEAMKVRQALVVLDQLMQSSQYGSEGWVLQAASQLAKIWIACNTTMEIVPPDSMTHIHLKYVQGMKHFDTMAELLAHGIDEADPELLNEAIVEMEAGTHLIDEADELMDEFTEEHS